MAEKKKQTAAKTPRSRSGTRSASGNKTAGKRAAGASRRRTGNSTVKKPASSGKKQPSGTREFIDYALYLEIILWIILAFAVLIFISFFGVGGAFGKAVSDRVFGMFGILAYLFPFVIFFLAAFLIANPKSRIARIKSISCILLYIILCGAMQMVLVGYISGYELSEYYEAGRVYHTGGGLLGGL